MDSYNSTLWSLLTHMFGSAIPIPSPPTRTFSTNLVEENTNDFVKKSSSLDEYKSKISNHFGPKWNRYEPEGSEFTPKIPEEIIVNKPKIKSTKSTDGSYINTSNKTNIEELTELTNEWEWMVATASSLSPNLEETHRNTISDSLQVLGKIKGQLGLRPKI